ncbi:hypothetical protein AHAS_Ahas01G0309000 [Arachis hypogaea]
MFVLPTQNSNKRILNFSKKNHDLRCLTRSIARMFAELSVEKKTIVEEMGFGEDHFPEKVEYNKVNEQQKKIVDSFKGATLASLTKSVIDMSVEGEENLLKFKTTFVVFVQNCFLLPTTVSTVSPVHKPSITPYHTEFYP